MINDDNARDAAARFDKLRDQIEGMELPGSLSELLDRAVERWGDRPALNFFETPGARYTFGELGKLSLAMADALLLAGVVSGSRVSVVLPNVPIFPITWLAIARLGAVMVPANPRFTPEELAFVFSDTRPVTVVTTTDLRDTVEAALSIADLRSEVVLGSEGASLAVDIEGVQLVLADHEVEPRAWPEVTRDDLLGIHYTSGTTGFPKGCQLTHHSWLMPGCALIQLLPIAPARILSDGPFFYLDAPMEMVSSLAAGAEQYVAARTSLSRFTGWLAEFDIDYVEVWEALGDRVIDEAAEARIRTRGRPLYCSSFGLNDAQRSSLEQRLNAVVREMYGMSEIGLGTVVPFDARATPPGSCGLRGPFRETRVVDPESGVELGVGAVGELWVRGPGVMLGYHDRPETNAEVLPGGGWFRTGDLMQRDPDGYHFIVGRLKDMVRRSHENIAAGEVEEALGRIKGVDAVGVVGVADPFRGEEVKAFVVLEGGRSRADIAPSLIEAEAGAHLAPFKIPRYIEYVADLPLTASGKVSKSELRKLDAGRPPAGYDRVDRLWRSR